MEKELIWDNLYTDISFGKLIGVNSVWMVWNTFLALIPVALAWVIFKRYKSLYISHKYLFGALFFLFYIFLPNSVYVLTDLIHLVDQIRFSVYSYGQILFILIPQYVIFIAIGIAAYLVVMYWWFQWIEQLKKYKRLSVIVVTYLSPVLLSYGIWLGRFPRFNSWDLFSFKQIAVIWETSLEILEVPWYWGSLVIGSLVIMGLNLAVLLWSRNRK